LFTFEHKAKPLQRFNPALKRAEAAPMWCSVCQKFHAVKTYHVQVDDNGFAFVSIEIWELMKQHGTAGFELANEVSKPPAQKIAMPNGKTNEIPVIAPKEIITSG